MKTKLSLVMIGLLLSIGCGKHEKPNFEYMPQMVYDPGFKAQEAQYGANGMRLPVKGTVPRGFEVYPYAANELDRAGAELKNPLPLNRATLERGYKMFSIYCQVCHGEYGEGNGSIVPIFAAPPTLQSDKIKDWMNRGQDGRIFHIITMGQNRMQGYKTQVTPEDRWAIAHFVRVLHRAKNPTKADLESLEKH